MKTIKSFIVMVLLVNLLTLSAYGKGVSYDDAKNVALNWIYSTTEQKVSVDNLMHDSGTDDYLSEDKAFHIIRLETKGWVIVSGNDSVEPIIAWSTESSLGTADSLPSGFIAWMEKIEKQIKEVKSANTQSDTALEEKWKKLIAYPEDFRLDGISYKSNGGYAQDVILDISAAESGTTSTTASGGVVYDGWYIIDVTANSSSVDQGEGLASVGSAGEEEIPPPPTNIEASDGTYEDYVLINDYYSTLIQYRYKIYRAESLDGVKTYATLTTLNYAKDYTYESGKRYYYWVRACNYDDINDCSDYSPYDIGWRGEALPAPPATPTGISASDGTHTTGVMISNYSVSNATGYKIYRNGIYMGLTTGTQILDTTAIPGTYYNYSVKACNDYGCSDYSDYDIGWRGIISAPTDITASDGTLASGVVIGNYSVYGATHYKIYRAKSADDDKTYLGLTYDASYKDTGAWPGYRYYYFVKACNSVNCSDYSSYDTGWRISDIPTAPQGVSATGGTLVSGVVITWGSVSDAIQYLVYRDGNYIGAAYGTSYKDENAQNGIKYDYSVTAKNSAGNKSAMSASDSGWRKALPAPSDIMASVNFLSGIVISNYSVIGATNYKIYRFHPSYSDPRLIKDTELTSYKDTTAASNTEYSYYVTACNSGGCSISSDSVIGWRAKWGTPPPVPTNIDASDGLFTSGIVLKDYSVSGATSYKFYRSTSIEGSNTVELYVNSALTSWKDIYVQADTFYYYRVAACVTVGAGYITCSMPSTVVDRGWRR